MENKCDFEVKIQELSATIERQAAQVDDLAALVRQLVHNIRKAAPGNAWAEKAMDYLQRKGLQGSPLRGESAQDKAQPRSAVVLPERKSHPKTSDGYVVFDPAVRIHNDCLDEVARLNPPGECVAVPEISARVIAYTPGEGKVEFYCGAIPQWLELGETVTIQAVAPSPEPASADVVKVPCELTSDAPARQVTDDGRNPRYEGLFDGETEEQRTIRRAAYCLSESGQHYVSDNEKYALSEELRTLLAQQGKAVES